MVIKVTFLMAMLAPNISNAGCPKWMLFGRLVPAGVKAFFAEKEPDESPKPKGLELSASVPGASREDYYLLHPPEQPKEEIAEYVGSQGIKVPRRFPNLRASLVSGVPFIIRSEHPLEYTSAAGILESHEVGPYMLKWAREDMANGKLSLNVESGFSYTLPAIILARYLAGIDGEGQLQKNLANHGMEVAKDYARHAGIDAAAFASKISYSYWELLEGQNRFIIADSAVPERYHINTTLYVDGRREINHVIVDKGVITFNEPKEFLPPELAERVQQDVAFYEKIRNLGRFNPTHCPLVEFQTLNGENYFLQYHRTRDFQASAFTLARPPLPGEVEADLVRGATGPEGIVVKTKIWGYGERPKVNPQEEAAFEIGFFKPFSEVMSRRRRVQFLSMSAAKLASDLGGHQPRSRFFNSGLSVVIPLKKLMSREDEGKNGGVHTIQVISDGKKAYVKVLD